MGIMVKSKYVRIFIFKGRQMHLLHKFLAFLMTISFLGGQAMASASVFKIGDDYIEIGRVYFKKINVSVEHDYMDIIVDTNPTTGFDWVVSDYDDQIIKVMPTLYQSTTKEKDLCGAGSIADIKINALKTGTTSFKLRYMRNWEGGEIADQFNFFVEVDNNKNIHIDKVEKITVEYGY